MAGNGVKRIAMVKAEAIEKRRAIFAICPIGREQLELIEGFKSPCDANAPEETSETGAFAARATRASRERLRKNETVKRVSRSRMIKQETASNVRFR